MFKCFITTGCSFTEIVFPDLQNKTLVDTDYYEKNGFVLSWPVYVNNILHCKPIYKGKGASGNGIISRTTIYETYKALETYKPEEIIVGIMWSGAYRAEVYSSDPKLNFNKQNDTQNGVNPSFISDAKNFYKVMPYWDDEYSNFYYKYIYDDVGAYMHTLENILRTQWYLNKMNIKYFMTSYYPAVFPQKTEIINHSDIKYLYNMIDFSNFLDVDSEYEWCVRLQDPTKNPWYSDLENKNNPHPNSKLHKAFSEQVIIPHLKNKGWI